MGEWTLWDRFVSWLEYLPVRLAFRIIWLAALVRLPSAESVYVIMWRDHLDLPRINRLIKSAEAMGKWTL